MYQLSHFKYTQLQSFGSRKLDFMVLNRETAAEFLHGCTNPLDITPQHPAGVQVWHMEPFLYHQDTKCKKKKQFALNAKSASLTWRCDSSPESEGDCIRVGTSRVCGCSQVKWISLVEIM